MRQALRTIITVLAFGLFTASVAAAQTVRVIATRAPVHLKAEPNSDVIATVPSGTVLDVFGHDEPWYAVWLPASSGEPRRLGFIAASDVESKAISSAAVPARSVASAARASRTTSEIRAELEGFGGSTVKLDGARAIVSFNGRTEDSGSHTALATAGMAMSIWDPARPALGFYLDFSGVNPGTATAFVGPATETVTASLFDMHFGYQIAAHHGPVRPYANVCYGFYHQRTTFSGSVTGDLVDSETHASYLIGGGVKVLFNHDTLGVRIGADLVAASLGKDPVTNTTVEKDYGRLVFGFFRVF